MTLRVTLEVVPHGEESMKYEISRLDISNIRTVKNIGFGNEYCEYTVTLTEDGEVTKLNNIPEHNRKDGAWGLIRKALNLNEGM